MSARRESGHRILVNRAFAMQRVTGQQRYAAEISARLGEDSDFATVEPLGFWRRGTLQVWLWLQLILPMRAARSVLLSMTARAPAVHRRHVLVVHDVFVLTNPEWFSRRYVLSHAPLLRWQLRRAAAVVAVSEPVAEQIAAYYRGPISVAPNAPSTVFREPSADAGAELERRDLVPGGYLLAVGSIDPRKNLPRLAAAYGALDENERQRMPLVLVGGGSRVFRDERIAWPAHTIDAGYVSDEQLRDLYAGARAVVFPSLAEGFGLPLVEAAAAGARSLVVSDIPVFRWICGDGARYVDPNSVPALTAALRLAASEPHPITLDPDRFDWDASAAVVRDACRAVASAEPVGARR